MGGFIHLLFKNTPKKRGKRGKKRGLVDKFRLSTAHFLKLWIIILKMTQNKAVFPKNTELNKNSCLFLWINIVIFLILKKSKPVFIVENLSKKIEKCEKAT